MCLSITRLCPGCGKVVDSSEVDACNDAGARYHHTQTFKLPLRREHFDEWNCPSPDCPFNNDHVQTLERRYLVARLAQRGGDLNALAPSLTADGKSTCYPVKLKNRMLIGLF
jgi:hypothetical protein